MPTVIALDLSLSMCQPIPGTYPPGTPLNEIPTKHTLALQIINQFLDHISTHSRLEFVSLLAFSRLFEKITDFTRDVEVIRNELPTLKHYEKTNYEAILDGISEVVVGQWGNTTPVQIVLITDGSAGFGEGCLKDTTKTARPFPFPAKMNVLCLSDTNDKNYTESCHMLQKLIQVTCDDGAVYLPENHLNSKGCNSAVAKLCAKDFTPYKGKLSCGKLSSKITLCPPPQPFVCREDEKRYDISETIDIIGLIDSDDLASPPAHSRHLVLPLRCENVPTTETSAEEVDEDTDGKIANFCVLLHGALKIEKLCAFCEIGPEWYGLIYSFADNKKKSNLMLSILAPGTDVAPWLGNLENLGPKDEFIASKGKMAMGGGQSSSTSSPQPNPFPVKTAEKKSYGSNPTVWISSQSINSDINKLLRHARKMPEKTGQFYKELNRMRRWALALGFYEILESIAQVLDRECVVLTGSPPETAIQLSHAASQIRLYNNVPYSRNIAPAKH